MEVRIDPKILGLVADVDTDISRVMSEALDLWLRERLPKCPITEDFCENLRGSCNNCSVTSRMHQTREGEEK